MFPENLQVTDHGLGRIVSFGDGDPHQPRLFERGVGEAVDGELYAIKRFRVLGKFAIQTETFAHVQPIFRMRLARLADKIFAFFFDCLRQPGSAHFRKGAIV